MSQKPYLRPSALKMSLLLALIASVLAPVSRAGETLVVHEWGTFTALQNEKGDPLPGINIDDEPLPSFCHNLYPWALAPSRVTRSPYMMKGAPERHPYVTLRLETPVLYFHPAAGTAPFTIDVAVKFRGGWLTEFYPHAVPDEPGLKRNEFDFGPITSATVGSLSWHKIEVGASGAGPETKENVWVAPRNVAAAMVTVPPQTEKDDGPETERFLFYRGVANRSVPLRTALDLQKQVVSLRGQSADIFKEGQQAQVSNLWLVDVRPDGSVAWRALDPITLTRNTAAVIGTASTHFGDREYSAAHLEELRAKMHAAIVSDGLYDDEATAMLNTWKRVYFQCPGLRLFFLVPRPWTDEVLPLSLSRPAEVQRVMMGRIELISQQQRDLLTQMAAVHVSDPKWLSEAARSPNAEKFFQGRSDFGDLGLTIPADYQMYLDLGRFRNALILAEQRARPTDQLTEFIHAYGLSAYQVSETEDRAGN